MRNDNNEHIGHRERVKRRFEIEGLANFEPHQVLELLLFYGVPQRDTNVLAHRLIEKFGSIDRVFDADIFQLEQVSGIGYNAALLLKLIPQIAQYYAQERFERGNFVENSDQIGSYMCSKIGFFTREVLAVAAFNAAHKAVAFETIEKGVLSQTEVSIRRLAEFAINNRADIIAISHNHVTGSPMPSQTDIEATQRICSALREIGIRVVDHFIVVGEKYFSFAENEMMPL